MAAGGDDDLASKMRRIKHVILVLSGKGGVGKSTMSCQIALSLATAGKKVGLLDTDLCGPSIPRMLGLEGRDVHQGADGGWAPVYTDDDQRLGVISIGFMLKSKTDPVVWRGPKKSAMIKQFLGDVLWGDLDYLIVDTPPGTSDEHMTIVESLRGCDPEGAILVTTPQGVALADVRREASFCKQADIKILGMVENMSGFVCPHCAECSNVFSSGGGERLATALEVPFLGRVPLDPSLARCAENGKTFCDAFAGSPAAQAVVEIVKPLVALDA
eukprot:m.69447 g.69447  ORF g.69447 m.69447 type:complete len:272 (+) comp13988_c1_seq2:217-1032(+)